jgi:hypothetical protein
VPGEDRDGWRRFNADRAAVRSAGRYVDNGGMAVDGLFTFLLWIGVGIVYGIVQFALTKPEINMTLRQLRVGRRKIDFSRIEVAHLVEQGTRKSRNLELNFGPVRGPRLIVELTRKQLRVLDPYVGRHLAEMFDGSGLWSEDDGRQAGARSGLSRQQAHDVVLKPPLPGERLPTPAG